MSLLATVARFVCVCTLILHSSVFAVNVSDGCLAGEAKAKCASGEPSVKAGGQSLLQVNVGTSKKNVAAEEQSFSIPLGRCDVAEFTIVCACLCYMFTKRPSITKKTVDKVKIISHKNIVGGNARRGNSGGSPQHSAPRSNTIDSLNGDDKDDTDQNECGLKVDKKMRDDVTWQYVHYTRLISSCAKDKRWQQALNWLSDMKRKGLQPNVISYCAAIGVCAKSCQWEKALDLLGQMTKDGLTPDVICFNAVISACARGGQCQKSLELFDAMRRWGLKPSIISWNAAIDACAKDETGCHEGKALLLLEEMRAQGMVPNVRSYSAAINACAQIGSWQNALYLLCEMNEHQVKANVASYSAAINACAKAGRLAHSLELLETMQRTGVEPNLICWSTTINAAAKCGRWERALSLLGDMMKRGVQPDEITYCVAVHACEKAGQQQKSLELLEMMRRQGLKLDLVNFVERNGTPSVAGFWPVPRP